MIIVTGASGFIGSCLLHELNKRGYRNLLLVDDFSRESHLANWQTKDFVEAIPRESFFTHINRKYADKDIKMVFHLGARTDTTERDVELLNTLNLNFSKHIFEWCAQRNVPLLYASSAATYGAGEFGYSDRHTLIPDLKPLNEYGWSKQRMDVWSLEQKSTPPHWWGMKFFNVYGPNEYHKSRMASVVFHAFQQIQKTGEMKLFRSHKPGIADGAQMRDFIYVKDVVGVLIWIMENRPESGVYNLGSGKARSFNDLVVAVFDALQLEAKIQYVDTPVDIRKTYQYFTQADMGKLHSAGYDHAFASLEMGITDYVRSYLRYPGKSLIY